MDSTTMTTFQDRIKKTLARVAPRHTTNGPISSFDRVL
jgi:hypothetical protein